MDRCGPVNIGFGLIGLCLGVGAPPPRREECLKLISYLPPSSRDSQSAPQGWKTPYIPALLPVSALLLLSFIGWEYRVEKEGKVPALMPLSIWKKPYLAVICALSKSRALPHQASGYDSKTDTREFSLLRVVAFQCAPFLPQRLSTKLSRTFANRQ